MPQPFLQVVHGLYPQANGGVEQYAWEVAHSFGGAVLSLTLEAPADPEPWRGLRVLLRQPSESPRAAWERALDEVQPGLVLVQHLGAATPGLLLELSARNIPYVVFLHDFTAICPTHKLWHRRDEPCSGPGRTGLKCAWCVSGSLRRGVEIPIRAAHYQHRPQSWRTALARAEFLIANSRFSHDFWLDQGAPPERLGVIAPVLRLPRLPPASLRVIGKPRVLYAGGWSGAKGADVLMSALDLIPEPVELVVAGPIPPAHVEAFRAAAPPRHTLTLPGPLAPEAMAVQLTACHAVAVPSRWEETYGRLVTEAQLGGIPVAAAAVGGIPERIVHGVNGFLAAPGDATSFAEALSEALLARGALWNPDLARQNAEAEVDEAHAALKRLLEGKFDQAGPEWSVASRWQWNHALAFFLGAGCRHAAPLDVAPEAWGSAVSWFIRWGLKPAPSTQEADAVLAQGHHATGVLRHRFPAAKAAVLLLPDEVVTISLAR